MVLAFIGGIGFPELMIILIVALLLFGRRLPEVARSLGRGIVEFKRGMSGIEDDIEKEIDKNASTPKKAAHLESAPAETRLEETQKEPAPRKETGH
jgi:sec-independent protein translocase protein TatA